MANCLIITGGSRGIGKATIKHFLKQNWKVINLSRSACDIAGVENIAIDLATRDWQSSLTTTLHKACKEVTKISLVHCAAANFKSNIADLAAGEFEKSLQINLVSPSIINQIAIPLMQPGSSIIYIGSTLSTKAVPNAASYVIVKHALIGMMRATCQDMDNTGIHTCCICPGFTNTEMLQEYCDHDQEVINHLTQMVSARRLIEPQEIANVIYFSAENPVINGTILHANLGQIER